MSQRAAFVAMAVLALQPMLFGTTTSAAAPDRAQDRAIERAFDDVLDREPTERELRRYRDLMEDEYWTERDIRDDLEERSDYRRQEDPEKVIRRAYEDILDRKPDSKGLRLYRSRMIDDDWTEQDVREALRSSPEYVTNRQDSADKIVSRAYEDIFNREADSKGLRMYRGKILDDGWDEQDVRRALKKSPEYRQRNRISGEDAEEIVRRAYLSVLDREPDPGGMTGFKIRVLNDHWNEEDVARELRKSQEYKDKSR